MDKLDCVKGTLFAGLLLSANHAYPASQPVPVRVNNLVIPGVFASALQQGMNVPVFIRYNEDSSAQRSLQKIADAVLSVKEGAFLINQVSLSDLPESTEISP